MRSCAGDRGRLLAVSYPLSALRRLVDGGKADSALPPSARCSLCEAMHKIVPHFPLGDTTCLRQQAIIFACGAGEESPLNPLSLMNSLYFLPQCLLR